MGQYERPIVYAFKHRDIDTRMASRSGGIFTALTDDVLKDGGIVYGCVLTDDFRAKHIRAENEIERDRMRGSKYIQSDLQDVFKCVEDDLRNGNEVLFSGTSCQVAGLRSFLNLEYDNLMCVDIVCHGVPSPLVWKEYLRWHEKKERKRVVAIDFRNKKDFGWKKHIETIYFTNGRKKNSEVFKKLFYGHAILRPSCYRCPYKSIMHPGDITIADYWGIDKAAPGFNDDKGVSLVLINNDNGKLLFEESVHNMMYRECDLKDSMQPPLEYPFSPHVYRYVFWEELYAKSFDKIVKDFGDYGIANDVKHWIKRIIKCFLRI